MENTFYWDRYQSPVSWVRDRSIYITKHGSHAYGTNLPTSDLDIRGIAVAPKEYYLGFSKIFEQQVQTNPDITIFDIKKFFKLAADGNPNALEIIFTDESDHIFKNKLGELLLENRDLFLSKKIKHTFMGYAHSQLKRINTHRRWILNPVLVEPTRKDFGLPEATLIPADQLMAVESTVKKKLDQWEWHELDNLDTATRQSVQDEFVRRIALITHWNEGDINDKVWFAASRSVGLDTNMIEVLDKERRYSAKRKDWENYHTWLKTRNKDRAALEEKYHMDTKHCMHLVRLATSCYEALLTSKLNVKRPDAKELLEIRHGAWTYEQLMDWFADFEIKVNDAYNKSVLPRQVNLVKLDALCQEIIEMAG